MAKDKESLLDVGEFIAQYAAHLMGCGVHTSRIIRNSIRLGEAYGYTVGMSVFPNTIILTLHDKESNEFYNEVIGVPSLPIRFSHNSELSALSWEVYDNYMPLSELWKKYKAILAVPAINPFLVLFLVSCANASFCRLFGGDATSMGIVFIATTAGMFLKQRLMAKTPLNLHIIFIISAFLASMIGSVAFQFEGITSDIALATSVLYLVPGVPLINGFIDIVEGHSLTGFSRLVKAGLLIVCIAIGLSFTLMLVKNSLL